MKGAWKAWSFHNKATYTYKLNVHTTESQTYCLSEIHLREKTSSSRLLALGSVIKSTELKKKLTIVKKTIGNCLEEIGNCLQENTQQYN